MHRQFINNHRYKENNLPTGVHYDKARKKYVAQLVYKDKRLLYKRFATVAEAEHAYLALRDELVRAVNHQN